MLHLNLNVIDSSWQSNTKNWRFMPFYLCIRASVVFFHDSVIWV